jgi:hypothetical protein
MHDKQEPSLATPLLFWEALLVVRNVLFTIREEEYFLHPALPPIDSFRESLDIVDCYLDQVKFDE